MKRYIVRIEYFDYNDDYKMYEKKFRCLMAAKIFYSRHNKKPYTIIKLFDNLKDITLKVTVNK